MVVGARPGLVVLLGAAVLLLCGGCSSAGYLAQSVGGHLDLLWRARPVPEWLADAQTAPALRERLELAQRLRDFAVAELKLPDNAAYRRYAELPRPAAVWNVVAAPELDLKLKNWCWPVAGCVSYRGYFERAAAETQAAELRAAGLETSVYAVPAYSTLGLLPGAFFADPLLSTFIAFPEGELARLIFHELAHQVAYAKDDTEFNESFATAVERLGGARWMARHASAQARAEYERFDGRRRQFRELAGRVRAELETVYRSAASEADKREGKRRLLQGLREAHAALKAGPWAGYGGYDAWFAGANNAALGVFAAYQGLVPAFERLFEREGGDFARFYAEVRRLAVLPREQRRATLTAGE